MVQNHILQVVALLSMELLLLFLKEIRLKSKALRAIRLYSEEEALQNFVQ